MEISKEKLVEIQACLKSSLRIMKRVICGVRFDGVFKNEIVDPVSKSGKLVFELENLIKEEKKVD